MSQTTNRTLLALLTAGALSAAAAAAPADAPLLPGAKLLHRFPHEVYRVPALLQTDKGPRLLLWVDAFDPTAPRQFPFEPLKDPEFDLIVWDVKTSKELHKLTYPKGGAPHSPVPANSNTKFQAGPFGSLALSPDGKELAALSVTWKVIPGNPIHEATTRIKLFDMASDKTRPANDTAYKGTEGPYMLFAPDGALVFVKDTTCTVLEPGKDKPRKAFEVAREPGWSKYPWANQVRDAVVSPDGKALALGVDGRIEAYDLGTGKSLLDAPRATPDAKGVTAVDTSRVSLAFSPGTDGQKLLAVEIVTKAPKSFVLARLFDLENKKEMAHKLLAEGETKAAKFGNPTPPDWGRAYAYFTEKGEPRVLFDGKVIEAASGKQLQKFNCGAGLILSRDGKYLVRLTPAKDAKKIGVELWSLGDEK